MAIILSFVSAIIELLAPTNFGQFIIKKVDSVLWILERPAKYYVHGDSKSDNQHLHWLLFWTILINLQIFRVVISTILIQFNKGPIEPNDVVKYLQKWRRSLRSIRFRGLRKMRESGESRKGNVKLNGNSVNGSTHPWIQPSKKRNYDEMLDHEVLEDLVNRTFSSTDDADSTFRISKIEEISTNASSTQDSHSEDKSPHKPKDNLRPLFQDTLPTGSTSESEITGPNLSAKSTEITFESTVADADEFVMTKDGSTSSLNEESRTKFESNGKLSIGSDPNLSSKSEPNSKKPQNGVNGKEALNQPLDPTDVLMSNLVEKGGAVNQRAYGKYQKNNKKNWKGLSDDKLTGIPKRNSTRYSRETLNLQQPVKQSKSQESIEKKVGFD